MNEQHPKYTIVQDDAGSYLINGSMIEELITEKPRVAAHVLEQTIHTVSSYQKRELKKKNTLAELKEQMQTCHKIKEQYETAIKTTHSWNRLITPVCQGLECLTYVGLAYCVITMHNDVCATPSHTPLHYYVCNPLG